MKNISRVCYAQGLFFKTHHDPHVVTLVTNTIVPFVLLTSLFITTFFDLVTKKIKKITKKAKEHRKSNAFLFVPSIAKSYEDGGKK
jgi:hypothetical protein